MNVRATAEQPEYRLADIGIQMHRIDDLQGFIAGQVGQRRAYLREAGAEIFAAVTGDEQQRAAVVQERKARVERRLKQWVLVDTGHGHQQRIDDRIPGDDHSPLQRFRGQVAFRADGGREQEIADYIHDAPVHFLGPGLLHVAGS